MTDSKRCRCLGSGSLQAEHLRIINKEPKLGTFFSLWMFLRGVNDNSGIEEILMHILTELSSSEILDELCRIREVQKILNKRLTYYVLLEQQLSDELQGRRVKKRGGLKNE